MALPRGPPAAPGPLPCGRVLSPLSYPAEAGLCWSVEMRAASPALLLGPHTLPPRGRSLSPTPSSLPAPIQVVRVMLESPPLAPRIPQDQGWRQVGARVATGQLGVRLASLHSAGWNPAQGSTQQRGGGVLSSTGRGEGKAWWICSSTSGESPGLLAMSSCHSSPVLTLDAVGCPHPAGGVLRLWAGLCPLHDRQA